MSTRRIDLSNRRTLTSTVAIAVLFVLIVAILIAHVAQGSSNSSPVDPQLKRIADAAIPRLEHPSTKLPIPDASLTSFQAWVYDTQPTLAAIVKDLRGKQWAQLLLSDPNPFPPQAPLVNVPGHPAVPVDPNTVAQTLHSGHGQYTTSQGSNGSLRVYVVPFKPPSILAEVGCKGVLEVISPEK